MCRFSHTHYHLMWYFSRTISSFMTLYKISLTTCLLLYFFGLNNPTVFHLPLQNVFPDIWSFSFLSCVLIPAGHICLEAWCQKTWCHTQIYTLPGLLEQRDYFRGLSSSVVFYVAQTANLQFVVYYEFYLFSWRIIWMFLLYQKVDHLPASVKEA